MKKHPSQMTNQEFLDMLGGKDPYEGLTHFPKGSAMEGLRIPRRDDARRSAKRLLAAFKKK